MCSITDPRRIPVLVRAIRYKIIKFLGVQTLLCKSSFSFCTSFSFRSHIVAKFNLMFVYVYTIKLFVRFRGSARGVGWGREDWKLLPPTNTKPFFRLSSSSHLFVKSLLRALILPIYDAVRRWSLNQRCSLFFNAQNKERKRKEINKAPTKTKQNRQQKQQNVFSGEQRRAWRP